MVGIKIFKVPNSKKQTKITVSMKKIVTMGIEEEKVFIH